ncbi:MAG: ABC transporter substrate-binding protein [Verrucomicrobia bacterium]|nr:ABC transporter substrate-binding protein [Verrucomicrobiota bacterium]
MVAAAGFCLAAGFALAAAPARVVVISPHNAAIRYEFGRAFARWHQRQFGEPAEAEWRTVGGTSDAIKFVLSEFAAKPEGIGIDVFFGGGPEPCLRLAEAGLLARCKLPEEVLAGVPSELLGARVYDPDYRWYGAALSSFGVLENLRVQRLASLPSARRWIDLGDPRRFGWVGAGDPRRSGSMSNMYEAFLQAYGWKEGWVWLTRLAGNVDRFDRQSSVTARRVTLGEAACGLAIDFYGLTQVAAAGRKSMRFILPEDFVAVSVDGIALLKGAPHAATARRFIRFVMDEPGQKLWLLPKGHPEGPQRFSIERMSVRPALYERYAGVSNVSPPPFRKRQSFRYDPSLAQLRRDVLGDLFGAILVDAHPELRRAWRAVIRRGAQPEAIRELGAPPIAEAQAIEWARGRWRDAAFRNRKRIEWQVWAMRKYRRIAAGRSAAAVSPAKRGS